MADEFLSPGTRVRLDSSDDGPEFGVVSHCWFNEEIGGYDCYVTFFGGEIPLSAPQQKPYVLRYASSSLAVIE